MKRLTLALASALGLLVACAHARPLEADAAKVDSPIRAAEELGASNVPKAALHIQYAKDQFARAKQLEKEGDKRRSDMLLMRAQADAELALALTRDARTQNEVRALLDDMNTANP